MRNSLKFGALLGVILGSWLLVGVEAQPGPFSAQIQRAIAGLTSGTIPFTGAVTINRPGIAVTSTDGWILANATLSTAAVPVQQSPRGRFRSHVWNTTAVAADNTDDWWIESVPVSGTTPSGLLKFGSSLNGGATTYPFDISSAGFIHTNDIRAFASGSVNITASGAFGWVFSTTGAFYSQGGAGSGDIGLVGSPIGTLFARAPNASVSYTLGGVLFASATAPTIASGFGATPSVPTANGTAAFSVNVGTGGTASAGVLTMPASTTEWASCEVKNLTAQAANRADQHTVVTASTSTSLTVQNQTISTGAALAWTASDVLHFNCMGK